MFFPYEFDDRFAPLLFGLGVRRSHGVTITDTHLDARFGLLRSRTPLSNVVGTSISGDHQWFKAIGARLSFADDGLTFGTTARRGVCIEFAERIGPILGPRKHSALWVSVADCDALVAALSS